jgi:bidirectional [NiFe] hydrogenase diaphorase subunit
MVEITIDGIQTTAREGETILDAARRLGVEIPTLCAHGSLRPHRACRVCTVEVIRGDKVNYLTACTYRVTEPLVVNTRSEAATARRREIIAGLAVSSPGAEELVPIAREVGVELVPEPAGQRCIRCGLCVRVCDEVIGRKALTYEKGATGTPYATATDACIGCATCAALCPTGAIIVQDEDSVRRFPQAGREFSLVTCRECGRPITTEQHLAAVRERRALPDDVALVCGECKRAGFAGRVAAGESTAPARTT